MHRLNFSKRNNNRARLIGFVVLLKHDKFEGSSFLPTSGVYNFHILSASNGNSIFRCWVASSTGWESNSCRPYSTWASTIEPLAWEGFFRYSNTYTPCASKLFYFMINVEIMLWANSVKIKIKPFPVLGIFNIEITYYIEIIHHANMSWFSPEKSITNIKLQLLLF